MGADVLIDLLTLQNPEGDNGENLTNQLAAVDLRLTLPLLRNSQIYLEYGGEDTSGLNDNTAEVFEFLFGDQAFLVGLYVPRLTDDGRTTSLTMQHPVCGTATAPILQDSPTKEGY